MSPIDMAKQRIMIEYTLKIIYIKELANFLLFQQMEL